MFGRLKRDSSAYTEIVSNGFEALLQAIVKNKTVVTTLVHTDCRRRYGGLVDVGFDKHLRPKHCKNEFATGNAHVEGIEGFCSYANRRLVTFKNVSRRTFNRHLKKTEYRFNNRQNSVYKAMWLKQQMLNGLNIGPDLTTLNRGT